MSVNSFNICPKCGTSNGANARFCYQCGGKLKVPEEPTICPQCHSVNSASANFCKACGGKLKVGGLTKICPNCHSEIPSEQMFCKCGYTFTNRASKANKNKSLRLKGRFLGIVSILLILVFAFYVFAPQTIASINCRFGFTGNDGGVLHDENATCYGFEILSDSVKQLKTDGVETWLHSNLFTLTATVLVAVFALTLIVQLLCALVHVFSNKRSGNANVFYLVMLIVSGVVVAMMFFAEKISVLNWFVKDAVSKAGYTVLAIPAYYLLFYFISLLSKRRKNKLQN